MCGIVGYLDKTGENQPVGCAILHMLQALGCRGPDSAGVALFGPPHAGDFVVRVKLGDGGDLGGAARSLGQFAGSLGAHGFESAGAYARFLVGDRNDPREWVPRIESLNGFEVVSVGRSLEIVKQVGSPDNLDTAYGISRMTGSHGIGHTRLSTESKVDLSHSQPFWGHGRPDLAIVHNGHITNYHQLRRRYEQHGVKFHTANDSEVIAIYLAEKLNSGRDLESALRAVLRDLDGSYSCIAATASELGFVKDPFALKPLLVAETDAFVAIATEEIAIRAALPGDYEAREGDAKEVRVWRR